MTDTVIQPETPKQKGKPFEKGDKRINRKGRPKNFDALRKLAQRLAVEEIEGEANFEHWTRVEAILRSWASLSSDRQAQKDFLEIAYGKVPNDVNLTANIKGAIPVQAIDLNQALTPILVHDPEPTNE